MHTLLVEHGEWMSEAVEIARYPNRRLYDRSQKKYVTLGDVESMVLGGRNVRVLDSKTGEDLTRMVLIQIVLERHPERMKMFPVPFLHELLRADQIALDWFTVYFGQAKTLMEGVTQSTSSALVPGLDFWKAFLPNAGQKEPVEGRGDSSECAQNAAAERDTARQEMQAKLAQLELRLEQLERGDSGKRESSHDAPP